MMSWFFPWQPERKPDDIPALWAFADAIVRCASGNIASSLFNRCLEVDCVAITNLTMGMFWMRPETYLALDTRNRKLLDERGIAHEVKDWTSYLHFLNEAKARIPEKPFEFSSTAYAGEPDRKYWVFQGNPQYYDVVGALQHSAVKTWQANQHKNDIHPGDRVIIWVTGENAGCFALATVTSEVQTITEDVEEAAYRKQPEKNSTMQGVTLRIDTNLCEAHVSKGDLAGQPAFADFPAGRQGTNLPLPRRTMTPFWHWRERAQRERHALLEDITRKEGLLRPNNARPTWNNIQFIVHKDTTKGQGINSLMS